MPNYDVGTDACPIIIVENDADLCVLLRYVVEQTYPQEAIALASTSDAALQIYTHHGAQLVIIDHLLPALDGINLVHQLSANQAHLPIVLLASDETVEQTALACGVSEFVAKPFAIEQLVHSLVSVLPHARVWPDESVPPC
jgi:response regulator of citrate/malate metabolism